jgi:hypothetical protein
MRLLTAVKHRRGPRAPRHARCPLAVRLMRRRGTATGIGRWTGHAASSRIHASSRRRGFVRNDSNELEAIEGYPGSGRGWVEARQCPLRWCRGTGLQREARQNRCSGERRMPSCSQPAGGTTSRRATPAAVAPRSAALGNHLLRREGPRGPVGVALRMPRADAGRRDPTSGTSRPPSSSPERMQLASPCLGPRAGRDALGPGEVPRRFPC